MKKWGIRNSTAGKARTATYIQKMNILPLNLSRDNAYAAGTESIRVARVALTATITLFNVAFISERPPEGAKIIL